MKNKINKTVFSLSVLGFSFNAFAAMPDDFSVYEETSEVNTIPMTIPAQHEAIRGSVAYLLGQPTYNAGFQRVRPAFTQSGLAATLAYDFNDGKYVQADWLELFGNTQSVNEKIKFTLPEFEVFGDSYNGEIRNIIDTNMQFTNRTRSTFIRLGADIGQTMFVGDHLTYRLSFGGQYARVAITENFLKNFNPTPVDIDPSDQINRKSVFNGLGPRVGLGGEYNIGWNVKLVAQTYASLNIGNIKANSDGSYYDLDLDARVSESGTDTFRTIIPGLEGSLGVRYEQDFGDDYGVVYGEFGYQVISYFNTFSGFSDAITNGGISEKITSPSSFGQHAVYFKLGYNGELLNA